MDINKNSSIDSSLSPRQVEDSLNDEDFNEKNMIKVSPFTSKMDIGFKKFSLPNKELNLSSYRSNSNKHRIKNLSILESLRDPSIQKSIVITKKSSINPVTSNRIFRESLIDRSSTNEK